MQSINNAPVALAPSGPCCACWIARCAALDAHTDDDGICCLPSVRGEAAYIDLSLKALSSDPADTLKTLKQITDQLVVRTPGYRCQRCGFSARAHHWQCPGCKSWGSIKPVHGTVSE